MREKKRIALVIDYIESEYAQNIYAGAAEAAHQNGMDLLAFPISQMRATVYSYDYQYLAVASHLRAKNIDGIIFVSSSQLSYASKEYVASYLRSFEPVPVVSIGCVFDTIPSIIPSAKRGFSSLISHIIEVHGARRIALMSVKNNSQEVQERQAIYKHVLEEHQLVYDDTSIMYGNFSYNEAIKALSSYYTAKGTIDFDAIVALNDQMAFACVDFLKQHGIGVPEDVLVTGYDDEVRSAYISPALSTVNQEIALQGKEAVRALCDIFAGKSQAGTTIVDSSAIIRHSCGCTQPLCECPQEKSTRPIYASGAEWCLKRSQFVQLIHLYTGMQEEESLKKLRYHINGDLMELDINASAVVLFEKPLSTDMFEYFPLPTAAYVYAAYDKQSAYWLGYDESPLLFNPQETMLPNGIFAHTDGMYVISLYRSSTLYGYIIFRPGTYDVTVYSMVCKMISNAIANAFTVTQSEEKQRELEKEYDLATTISVTDEMTGLLNRRGFMNLGLKAMELSQGRKKGGMVLFGDMDGLKKINDTYGHAAGDRAIKTEALLLKRVFRATDIIGRLGGDEFAIVAPSMTERKYTSIRQHLEDLCNSWNSSSGEPFTISLSLGSAAFSATEKLDLKALLSKADEVLYQEKKRKKEGAHKTP